MIKSLTKAQEEHLNATLDYWLARGRSTDRINREKALEAVTALYAEMGEPAPKALYFSSPMAAHLTWADMLLKPLGDVNSLRYQTRDKLWYQLRGQLSDNLWTELRDELRDQLPRRLGKQFRDKLWSQMNGVYSCYLAVMYKFASDIGVRQPEEQNRARDLWLEQARWCNFYIPLKGLVLFSDFPTKVSLNERGQLHNTKEKAIEYSDGWGVYAYHGLCLPDYVIENQATRTVEDILKEKNSEYRRVMIDLMGIDRFFNESKNLKLIHKDSYGKLYHCIMGSDTIAFAKVFDGTHKKPNGEPKEYIIPVATEARTAHEAVALSYGINTNNYNPEVRT